MGKSIFSRIGLITQEDKVELEYQLNDIREKLQNDTVNYGKRFDELSTREKNIEAKLINISEAICRIEAALIDMNQLINDTAANAIIAINKTFSSSNAEMMKQVKQDSKKFNKMLKNIEISKATKDDVEILSSFLRFVAANQLIQDIESTLSEKIDNQTVAQNYVNVQR